VCHGAEALKGLKNLFIIELHANKFQFVRRASISFDIYGGCAMAKSCYLNGAGNFTGLKMSHFHSGEKIRAKSCYVRIELELKCPQSLK